MRIRSILLVLVLLSPTAARAQAGVTVSGPWTLQAEITLPQGAGEGQTPCTFTGGAEVDQDNEGAFTGTASLNLDSGPAECPQQVSADVSGTVDGTSINGMLSGGNLGDAFFDGSVVAEALTLNGTIGVETGPFGGAGGTWSGLLGGSAQAIPTLDAVGLVLLALLLVGLGWMVLARRRTA